MRHISSFIILSLFTFTTSLTAQINWTKYEENPLLMPGPTGAWDEVIITAPTVIFDGSTYHIWYSSYNDNFESIGYATSPDGITWTKYNDPSTINTIFAESDPVLNPGAPGSWDDTFVFGPYVLFIDTTYYMWYGGEDNSENMPLGLAISTDGIKWVKNSNNPILEVGPEGTWDELGIQLGSVVFDKNNFHMWYYGWQSDNIVHIGHATSQNGISWTKDPTNPVLQASDNWEYSEVRRPNVIFDGTTFHMFYTGGRRFRWRIGYAWSIDGSDWIKYNNNPVMNLGAAESIDDYSTAYCSVLWDTINNTYKMWYSGSDEEEVFKSVMR